MCHAQQVGVAKEDFLFVAREAYFKAMAWRSINLAYRCLFAGGVSQEGRMYVEQRSSMAMLCSM
jgi:hypothetical protein